MAKRTFPFGTPVVVSDGDSMYRSERGTVVPLDVRRSNKLGSFRRKLVEEGQVLVEKSSGELFVVPGRALSVAPSLPPGTYRG